MTHTRVVLSVALLLSFAGATPAIAQITTLSTRTAIVPVDSTVDKLTKRIEALESLVAQLQQKTAFIKSASPLMLDAGSEPVSFRAVEFRFDAGTGFNVRAGTNVDLQAGSDLTLRASNNTTIRGSGPVLVEAGAALDLKGSSVRHNGGSVPIACAASAVNGQTGAAGGLRGDHAHTVSLPIAPCSATVGVPGPGQ